MKEHKVATQHPAGSSIVAGAAGFLGSHLSDALIQQGHRVLGIDDFSTGRSENLSHLDNDPAFNVLHADVTDSNVGQMFPADEFDLVFHLASPASPPEYLRRPLETLAVGSAGTRNMLELARERGAVFFLASTSEVYGDPLIHPQPESYWGNVNPNGERSVYDEAKRFAEATTSAYARHFGLPVRIVRIFNTYGPRMRPDDGRVITNFITQALAGAPLTVYGDGSQTRSFCYVDDLITGLIALAKSDIDRPVNIGNPEEFTMLELARLVLDLTGSDSKIVHRPLPSDDPRQRCPDITLAANELNWRPETDLATGLQRTIDWITAETAK